MESVGYVVAAAGDCATVEVRRTSACEGCHKSAEGGCSVCTLMGGENSRATRARVRNPLGAKPGDRVRIESPASRVLLWAAAVFLLPLGHALMDSVAWQAAGAGIGFLLCFAGLRFLSGALKRRPPDAVITEIL